MQDRLRSAAARLAGRVQRLRPGHDDSQSVSGVDDDADAEELPPVDVDDAESQELSRLDEECPTLDIPDTVALFEVLRRMDPTPDVPLAAPHDVSFVTLLRGLVSETGERLLDDGRVRRVLDLVGNRLSLSVGPDGITVRGLIRRRHTPWDRIHHLTFAGRYDLLRGGYVTRLAEQLRGRFVPIPIPGLSPLMERVVGGISGWLEKKVFTAEEIESMRVGGGHVLTRVERRGFDIELSGPVLLVALLAPGWCEAVEQEARTRGVNVVVEGPE